MYLVYKCYTSRMKAIVIAVALFVLLLIVNAFLS